MKNTPLRRALQKNGKTAQDLADATGYSYGAVKEYVRGDSPMPGKFIRGAALFLGELEEEWLAGSREKLYRTLEAEGAKQRAQVDAVELPGMTPTEEAVLRAMIARWNKAVPCRFSERLKRLAELARMMDAPLERFGTELEARELSDFRLAQLHALSLAMPRRK